MSQHIPLFWDGNIFAIKSFTILTPPIFPHLFFYRVSLYTKVQIRCKYFCGYKFRCKGWYISSVEQFTYETLHRTFLEITYNNRVQVRRHNISSDAFPIKWERFSFRVNVCIQERWWRTRFETTLREDFASSKEILKIMCLVRSKWYILIQIWSALSIKQLSWYSTSRVTRAVDGPTEYLW